MQQYLFAELRGLFYSASLPRRSRAKVDDRFFNNNLLRGCEGGTQTYYGGSVYLLPINRIS
jgi:hypothetical protein